MTKSTCTVGCCCNCCGGDGNRKMCICKCHACACARSRITARTAPKKEKLKYEFKLNHTEKNIKTPGEIKFIPYSGIPKRKKPIIPSSILSERKKTVPGTVSHLNVLFYSLNYSSPHVPTHHISHAILPLNLHLF